MSTSDGNGFGGGAAASGNFNDIFDFPHYLNDERSGRILFHEACMSGYKEVVDEFFAACDQFGRTVQIDAQDGEGNTGLHLALDNYDIETAEVLLRRGADPNLANAEGSTPLHVTCRGSEQYSTLSTNVASAFLRVNEELSRHEIRIDARDNNGWTPLRLAVTRIMPNTVDVLLDRGVADLSNFVFPTEAHFDERLGNFESCSIEWKFSKAISAMTLVECLEKRGYELDRSDAMTIMRIVDKLGLFQFRVNDPTYASLLDDEQFTAVAKKMMVKDDGSDSTTLHDLIQIKPREAARRFTCMDCYELARAENKLWKLAYESRLACHLHLYEITSKGFFASWALDPFMELTHCRLPILCCEMIIDHLNNKDLYNICLAVEGRQRTRDGDRND